MKIYLFKCPICKKEYANILADYYGNLKLLPCTKCQDMPK